MSKIVKGDLVIVIDNNNPKFDWIVGRIATVLDIGNYDTYHSGLLESAYELNIQDITGMFEGNVICTLESIKKIEPLTDYEIMQEKLIMQNNQMERI